MRLLLLLLSFVCLPLAFAGPKEDAAKKKREGDKLVEQGSFSEALVAYDAAQALFVDVSLHLIRAQVLIKLRRFEDAKLAYVTFLESTKDSKQREEVKEALENIEIILQTKLVCTSTPTGTTVYLNSRVDKPLGVTPFESRLSPGSHRLIFEKDGYESLVVPITVEPKISQEARATLQELPALLLVKTEVPGVVVAVNGEERGKTPIELKLPQGEHEIEIIRPPYPPEKKRFQVLSGQRLTWEPALRNGGPGGLSLALSPSSAKVTLSGVAEPATDGATMSLYPGRYTLTATADGYQTLTKEIEIKSEQTLREELSLVFEGGVLRLTANRPGMKVSLDGAPALPSPEQLLLSEGSHTLTVSAPNLSSASVELYVKKAQELDAEIIFRRPPRPATKALYVASGLLAAGWIGLEVVGLTRRANAVDACQEVSDSACVLAAREFNGPGQVLLIAGDISGVLALGTGLYSWYRTRQEGTSSLSITTRKAP